MKYPNLFSELIVGKRTWRNRIVLSPMGDGMANFDGSVSDQLIAYYSNIARGGAAVISPGVTCVDFPEGKALVNTTRMDNVLFVKQYNQFVDAVHRYGALLIPQIHHSGSQTNSINTEGLPPVSSSAEGEVGHVIIKAYREAEAHRTLSLEEVKRIVQKFIQTAVYCKMAGCDGVTLHGAHSYLINQFLSPDINKRTDEYGGSFENRFRFAKEIVEGIRAECGPDFIIGFRMPGREFVPNGLTMEDGIEIALRLEEAGCDYLDVSYGSVEIPSRLMETTKYEQGNRVPTAYEIKKVVKKAKVGVMGLLRDPAYCEQILAEGKVDFVSLGRTLICDPEWPKKARAGKDEDIRPCLNCLDGCMGRVGAGWAVGCVLNPVVSRERELAKLPKADRSEKVLVVGGGLGGMQAAITAAEVGHEVTLLESTDKLGGQMNLASVPPNKGRINLAKEWFERQLVKNNVSVKLNTTATFDMVKEFEPDKVILATGAEPATPPIPGAEHGVQAWDILKSVDKLPENANVVVIGGGTVGCEIAELALTKNNKVSVIDMLPGIASGLEGMHLADLYMCFAVNQVNVQTNATVKEITANAVTYTKDGEDTVLPADLVVLATGQKSVGKELALSLKNKGYDVRVVGDAVLPRKFIDATREGLFAAID
ncbi:MAG: FAD-dependent oxidoreductase [Anaerolineaceae bacterium]